LLSDFNSLLAMGDRKLWFVDDGWHWAFAGMKDIWSGWFGRKEAQKLHFSPACLVGSRSSFLFFLLLAGRKELIEERNSMEGHGFRGLL